MVVQGSEDEVVPTAYGYDLFADAYADDPRFRFVLLEGKGHNFFNISSPAMDEFARRYDAWLASLGYDYESEANRKRFHEERTAFIRENLDRAAWCNRLDTELFDSFVTFFDEHLERWCPVPNPRGTRAGSRALATCVTLALPVPRRARAGYDGAITHPPVHTEAQ